MNLVHTRLRYFSTTRNNHCSAPGDRIIPKQVVFAGMKAVRETHPDRNHTQHASYHNCLDGVDKFLLTLSKSSLHPRQLCAETQLTSMLIRVHSTFTANLAMKRINVNSLRPRQPRHVINLVTDGSIGVSRAVSLQTPPFLTLWVRLPPE